MTETATSLPTYAWEPTTDALASKYGLARESIVRFDVNTSPMAPDLGDVLAGPFDPPLCEYPPSDYATLVAAAAESYGVKPDEVLPTAGADEALDLIARATLRQGSVAVVSPPTYAMYRIVSEQRGARVVEVPRHGPNSGFTIDIGGIVKAARGISLVWLCEPNNPTGTYEPPERITKLLDGLKSDAEEHGTEPPTVAMDEAYAEFVDRSVLPLRSDYAKLVVVRTLSEAHALAGARVGFVVARPETLAPIVAYRAPASVGTISAALATASLRRPELSSANVTRSTVQRSRLFLDLAELGWRPYPSSANFMLAQFSDPETASRAGEALLRQGLVPRTFDADHPLANCIRLTVRSEKENDRLIDAIRGIKL